MPVDIRKDWKAVRPTRLASIPSAKATAKYPMQMGKPSLRPRRTQPFFVEGYELPDAGEEVL